MLVGARLCGLVQFFLCMLGRSVVMAETDAHRARRREILPAKRVHGEGWTQLGFARTRRVEKGKARRGKPKPKQGNMDVFLHQVC